MDIGRVGWGPHPADDQSPAIQQYPKLDADDPAVVRYALAAPLARTAPLPDRVKEFNPIGIDHPQQGGLRHEGITPAPVALEQAKQPSTIRQMWKQVTIVANQPAVEGTRPHPLQGKHQRQGNPLRSAIIGLAEAWAGPGTDHLPGRTSQ